MADDQAPKAKRRTVKNPETFREKVLKATETPAKPQRRSRLKGGVIKVTGPVARPVGKAAVRVGQTKPVRILGKIIIPAYFRNSWQELRQVSWPSWRLSRDLTFAVIVFAAIFGAAVAGVDYGLDKLFRNVLLK